MNGVTLDIGVQGSNCGEVQDRLNLVDCGRDGEFMGASWVDGVHRLHVIVSGVGWYSFNEVREDRRMQV